MAAAATPAVAKICQNCDFFYPYKSGNTVKGGECRIAPPQVLSETKIGFLPVDEKWWCGAYKEGTKT